MENDIIQKILNGFTDFRREYYDDSKIFEKLVKFGQSPKAMLITCSDSRISTNLTKTDPGDLFTVRNVANLIPNFEDGDHHVSTTAALEFAVCFLKVKHIIVMGHSNCGGIAALMSSDSALQQDNAIAEWLRPFSKSRDIVMSQYPEESFLEQCHRCELQTLKQSLLNLRQYPWIKKGVDKKELHLHSWYYDLLQGELLNVNVETLSLSKIAPRSEA